MQAKDTYEDNFSFENSTVAVVKKASPQNSSREEFQFIEKHRTISR